tara:strand:- start:364 stop:519 length:156 start_codon:yes stop_codon:yes gene_type:complete
MLNSSFINPNFGAAELQLKSKRCFAAIWYGLIFPPKNIPGPKILNFLFLIS